MYFVYRDGEYVDLAGESFRRFMDGALGDSRAGQATVGDFADHMTTAFTDVRLKRFLEMRGADAGSLGDDGGAIRPVGRAAVRPGGAGGGRGRGGSATIGRASPRCGRWCRARRWTRRWPAARCATLPARWWRSRPTACARGPGWTQRGRTSVCTWRRLRRLPPASRRRPKLGSAVITAAGTAMSRGSSGYRRFDDVFAWRVTIPTSRIHLLTYCRRSVRDQSMAPRVNDCNPR